MLKPFRPSSTFLLVGLVTAALPGAAQPAAAPAAPPSGPPERAGFFLRMAPGFTFMSLDSDRSALSAFQQAIPSSATAYGGNVELQLGGAVMRQLVFAGAIEQISVANARVEILDQTVAVENLQFESLSLGLATTYYPWQTRGWYVSGKIAYGGLDTTDANEWPNGGSLGGRHLKGVLAEAGAGHEWWIGRHWWVGVGARAGYGHMSAGTDVLMFSLLATVTLF